MQSMTSPDEWLLHFADLHRTASLTSFARTLMDAGQSVRVVALCALLGIAAVVARRAWRPGIAMAAAFVASVLVADVLKQLIARSRPPVELSLVNVGTYSMPSTHAAMTSAVVVALLVAVRWRSRRLLRASAVVLGLALVVIGASMVYLGAHWASDILAGWALGIVVGASVGILCRHGVDHEVKHPS